MVRQFLTDHLPGGLVQFVRECRYRGVVGFFRHRTKVGRFRRRFDAANAGLAPDQFALRRDVVFRIEPELRWALEHFTHLDPAMVEEMDGFLALARDSKCLFDVGALYGIFALGFTAGSTRRALAFEPNPPTFARLERLLALNPECRIEAHALGLGAAAAQIPVETGFHFVAGGACGSGDGVMQVVALDDFIREHDIRPDVLKIDVEGFEHAVIAGARTLLREHRPLLFLELHPSLLDRHGASAPALGRELFELGYVACESDGRPAREDCFAQSENFRLVFRPRM